MRLCIDLGGSSVRAALMDEGNLLGTLTEPRSDSFDTAGLEEFILRSLMKFGSHEITGIAVAVPGVMNAGKSSLISAHGKYGALLGIDLKNWASSRFELPFGMENDARAALAGELAFGVAVGQRDAVLMVLGTGIGTAAVIDGVQLQGSHGHAAILGGHFTIDRYAASCPCGNVGCAESLGSTWALKSALENDPLFPNSAWAQQSLSPGIKELVISAGNGDELSIKTLSHFVNAWAITLVSLCHAYDPEVIIVTGGVLNSKEIVPQLRTYMDAHLWSSAHRPEILVPAHPQLSVMRGLSALDLAFHESNR